MNLDNTYTYCEHWSELSYELRISRKSDQYSDRDSATVAAYKMAAVTSSIMQMSQNSNAHH